MTMAATMPIDASSSGPTQGQSLIRLMTWLSPSFPTGAFAYSHGVEYAVHAGLIADAADLSGWIGDLMAAGSAWNDCVLFAESWRRARDGGALDEMIELADALAGSAERHLESNAQGGAFLAAAREWPHADLHRLPTSCALPVAIGAFTGLHGIALRCALTAALHGFANTIVQAGLRLLPLGQQAGVSILAGLETDMLAIADRASRSSLDDLGTAAFLSEIVAIKHETQGSRIFRS